MWIVEALSFLFVVANVVAVLPVYFDFPGAAATFPNMMENTEEYGDLSDVMRLTVFHIVVYTVITLAVKIPHRFNYPVPVTEENRERLYALGVEYVKVVK
jgi:hypothetical protein